MVSKPLPRKVCAIVSYEPDDLEAAALDRLTALVRFVERPGTGPQTAAIIVAAYLQEESLATIRQALRDLDLTIARSSPR